MLDSKSVGACRQAEDKVKIQDRQTDSITSAQKRSGKNATFLWIPSAMETTGVICVRELAIYLAHRLTL